MSDLLSSRWAPSASNPYPHATNQPSLRRPRSENRIRSTATPPPNHTSGALLPPSDELARFMKIVARLRWKLPFLAEGYRLATLSVDDVMASVSAADVAHAEIMFKIDFHEYYALLERAIVHLLGVFNIAVSSSAAGGARFQLNGGAGFPRSAGMHRYHANVLQALEEETTPLMPILGSGRVHELLRQAKELRNRWKTADMTKEERERDPLERKEIPPLASFDFEEIISGIFAGLEESYVRAKAHVDMCRRPGELDSESAGSESDWGFMVDAMDWEAV
ncbi:uncharacterized protein N7459_002339 [Penicillium hispanicum]|uniref:uncharacterized protein n=1 Tax=Penicillium hispanicum TaxID=1080232 RepID=UPI0025410273|nr:uncharacterized protein N7459_002339 [Penicillium hispanicum]KAJ5591970.1 hypothetical protein N7459_002339 [Penicillium hispanicum]